MNLKKVGSTEFQGYKESGVPWLESIPQHWDVVPGKAIFALKKDPNRGMKEKTVLSLSYGRIRVRQEEELHGLVPESFETYQVVDPGDIICRPTDLQNDWNSLRFGISNHRGIITSAYLCFTTLPRIDHRYGHLLLHTYDLKKIFYGLGSGLRQNLEWGDFKYLPCTLPPLEEQTAIARYLDAADQRIQAYVSAKERLIALLEEERQAVIHQTVTKGLDTNVKLKPSGVEWLGDVPEHWEVRKLKHVCSQKAQYGANIPASEYTTSGIRFLRTTDITADGAVVGEGVYIPRDLSPECLLNPGDILLTRSGATIGQSFLYDMNEHGECSFAGYLVRFSPSPEMLPKFVYLFTTSPGFQNPVQQSAIVSTIENVNAEKYANIQMPVPPLHEQTIIVRHLDELAKRVDLAIDLARRQIELMEEYRTRLIADVVTGKIDMREKQIPAGVDGTSPPA